jgi:hypothetical protein
LNSSPDYQRLSPAVRCADLISLVERVEEDLRSKNDGRLPEKPKSLVEQIEELI